MTREEILAVVARYRKLTLSMDKKDRRNYERFADYIEENYYIFENDFYETEESLFEYFNEVNMEVNTQWNVRFPKGYDDSITDFLANK